MPIPDGERIATLRARCLQRKHLPRHSTVVAAAQSLRASQGVSSWQVRAGLCTRDRLSAVRLEVDDLELLLGRLGPPEHTDAQLRAAQEYLQRYPDPGGQTGHCELDLSEAIAVGLDGLRQRVADGLEDAPGPQAEALQSFLHALDGFSALIENAAATAEAAIADADEGRKAELRRMADSCRRVAHEPPRTFRDAIQLLWLADFAVMAIGQAGLVVPGHLDRTLWPFYQADVAAGRLTRDEALVVIECLYLLINELVADGLAMSVMVGGRHADGRDATNELSYVCLEALGRTRLIYPTVGICWHEGTPRGLVDLAVELISQGCSTPAFFGDATIQRGLKRLGLGPQQACNYINSTCVEITPVGASNVWVASPYFNTCGLLLEEIAAQVESAQPAADFEGFLRAYEARLAGAIARAVAEQNDTRRRRQAFGRKPLQSVFTRDCIARGRDIDDGGADCNWVECSFVGLANLADSLHVICREVYEERSLGLAELKAALDADFAGAEPLRRRLLGGHPKYGNQCAQVDGLVGRIVSFCVARCAEHGMEPDGSSFVPGCFCWVMHERLGRETGATPDGRKAALPFADGGGPAQGREAAGPTAAILSTTSWDHSHMIGGLAYNMKFNGSLFRRAGSGDRLRDLVLTYLRRGGFETQINVVDADTLRAAQKDPEHYRDLIVRIGGYCDYFTRLSPQMQEEIIMRTEFAGV